MKYSNEQKNKSTVSLWLTIIIPSILIIIVLCGLTTFKKEVLNCSVKNDICSVEKTNLFGIKIKKNIANYSNIQNASYRKDRVKGNRYSKGYTAFILTFTKKNNYTIDIFSSIYFEPEKILKDIRFINEQVENNKDILLEKNN